MTFSLRLYKRVGRFVREDADKVADKVPDKSVDQFADQSDEKRATTREEKRVGESVDKHPSRLRRPARWLTVACSIAATAACSHLTPGDVPPAITLPKHYGVNAPPDRTVTASGKAQHLEQGATLDPRWWERYGSPTLNAFVEEGLAHNVSLSVAHATLAAAREQLNASVGDAMAPSIDAVAGASRFRSPRLPDTPVLPQRSTIYDNYTSALRATYTVDLFGASWLQNRALGARIDAQSFQLDASRNMLASQIVIGVVTAAALSDQYSDLQKRVDLAQNDAGESQQRCALGAISPDDALAAQARSTALQAQLPPLQTQLRNAQYALAVLLGRSPDQAPAPLTLDDLHTPANVPVSVPSTFLAQRPDILAAGAALSAAAAEVGTANAAMLPSLTITAALGRGGFLQPAFLGGPGIVWGALASLSMPIFHGGALRAQQRSATRTFEAARLQYRQTVLLAFQSVADALIALENDAVALSASEQNAMTQRLRWENREAQQRLGSVPAAVTRRAQQDYLEARGATTRARAARLMDTATLFNAMGVNAETGLAKRVD